MAVDQSAYESSVTAPPPGWAKRIPLDERVFMWLVLASVVAMSTFVLAWMFLGDQNVPNRSYATTPADFGQQITAMVDRYGAADGKVYLPAGTDGYVMGAQFSWYPELVLEAGKPYRIWLSAADTLHGFSLVGGGQNINLEVAPNHAYGATFTPDEPGRYLIVCNEYCGLGHHTMKGFITVLSPAAMQQALARNAAAPAAKPATAPAPGGTELSLGVRGSELAFDVDTLTAGPGTVTLDLVNTSAVPHNVAVRGGGIDVRGPVVSGGAHSRVTADLEAGTYVFYCSVPGHEAAGMKGTLVVEP